MLQVNPLPHFAFEQFAEEELKRVGYKREAVEVLDLFLFSFSFFKGINIKDVQRIEKKTKHLILNICCVGGSSWWMHVRDV